MAKGLARHIVVKQRPPRYGLPTQALARGMEAVLGPRGASAAAQNWRAALTCCFVTMSRGCECVGPERGRWDPTRTPLRGECKPSVSGWAFRIHEAKRCTLTGVAPGKRTTVYVPRGGAIIDPAAELDALMQLDSLATADAPLFRNIETGEPITVQQLREVVKAVAQAAGLNPANYGAHSLR